MRFITALLAMAIAVTVTTGGATETWVLDDDPALTWVLRTSTTVVLPVTTTVPPVHVDHTVERACVTIPIHVEADGDIYLGPESERTFTGGLTMSDIRVDLIGRFLNIGINQGYVSSWDMDLSSIDVTGLTEVTICE